MPSRNRQLTRDIPPDAGRGAGGRLAAQAGGFGQAAADVWVFESRRRWVPELARQFLSEAVRVRGFASIAAMARAMVNDAAGVAVLELDAAPADCLRWLAARVNGPSRSSAVVVSSRQAAELEPLVRELGAAEFVLDTVGGETLARICRQWVRNDHPT